MAENDKFNDVIKGGADLLAGKFKEAQDYLLDNLGLDSPTNLPKDYNLRQSKYDFTSRIFPNDLGEPGFNGHYMLININVSNYSAFETVNADGRNLNTFNRLGGPGVNSDGELSKVDALRANIDQYYTSKGRELGPGKVFVPRQTRRIVESIALYMPNTVVFSQNNMYEDVSLTGIAKNVLHNVPGVALGEAVAGLAQAPLNPRVEVLFSNTALRQFQFDFLFAPANPIESVNLQQIIQTIRFHAAPEVSNFDTGGENGVLGALKGLLWTPPSEFDITFYNRGKENTALPRINTCALEQVDVDYAPTGVYSTFRNGHAVRVRLQLRFKETESLHRLRVIQGF